MKTANKILWVSILIVLAGVGVYFLFMPSSPHFSARSDYSCRIHPPHKQMTVQEGERIEIPFRIQNLGKKTWESRGRHPYFLSYHLLDEKGELLRYENPRSPLPHPVGPNQSIEFTARVRSPLQKGSYILEFDIVREGITWFEDKNSPTAQILLQVRERTWNEDEYPLNLRYGPFTRYKTSIPEINQIHEHIRLTLDQNQVQFKGKSGPVSGFSAGTNYPQIWIRDSRTILPASRYFYPKSFLISWLEEHLAFQRKNGSLQDWVDSQGNFDKNTTATDQESSAVQAAYQIYSLLGPFWLKKQIQGKTIIQRLDLALSYVIQSRLNSKYGLITGAHTADWGDVDLVDKGQKAIYVDDQTHWTVDIYDQSMMHQACQGLSRMWEALDRIDRASHWKHQAQKIKENTNKWLWQEEKGFYRMHIHLDSLQHSFNEENMFALGGNTQAVLSSIADEAKAVPIILEALERQKRLKISTISGVLLPPYPSGIFAHPLLDEPYEYQNGAQWDWFGGRFIYAMFEHGFSSEAMEKLIEVLKKNLSNKVFYEWHDRNGGGRGSDFYCGSAASVTKALYEGYFGVLMDQNHLYLEPKIGKEDAQIHLYQPANDRFVAYNYDYEPSSEKLLFRYNSNFPSQGKVAILSPWILPSKKTGDLQNYFHVLRDGEPVRFSVKRKNRDFFIIVETDFREHLIEISVSE